LNTYRITHKSNSFRTIDPNFPHLDFINNTFDFEELKYIYDFNSDSIKTVYQEFLDLYKSKNFGKMMFGSAIGIKCVEDDHTRLIKRKDYNTLTLARRLKPNIVSLIINNDGDIIRNNDLVNILAVSNMPKILAVLSKRIEHYKSRGFIINDPNSYISHTMYLNGLLMEYIYDSNVLKSVNLNNLVLRDLRPNVFKCVKQLTVRLKEIFKDTNNE